MSKKIGQKSPGQQIIIIITATRGQGPGQPLSLKFPAKGKV